MQTITKKDIIESISSKYSLNKFNKQSVKNIIQSFMQYIICAVYEGKRIEIRDFGVFSCVLRKPKIGRNPRKSAISIPIPARYQIKFKPAKNVKQMLDEKEAI